MCAGTNGYYSISSISGPPSLKEFGSQAYHESFEVRPPPLGETVTDFPFVVDPVGGVELARLCGWGETIVQSPFEAFDFVFTGFKVVARAVL